MILHKSLTQNLKKKLKPDDEKELKLHDKKELKLDEEKNRGLTISDIKPTSQKRVTKMSSQ